jgi:hypothetical protein
MELRWLLFGILLRAVSAFCPSGCTCSNETRNVICDNIRVDSIPVFLNPALIRLSLKNSHVKLDRDSIRLYRGITSFTYNLNRIFKILNIWTYQTMILANFRPDFLINLQTYEFYTYLAIR